MLLHVSVAYRISSSGRTHCSVLNSRVIIMNISLLWAMWQHIMHLCVRCFQCREVYMNISLLWTMWQHLCICVCVASSAGRYIWIFHYYERCGSISCICVCVASSAGRYIWIFHYYERCGSISCICVCVASSAGRYVDCTDMLPHRS